MKRIFIVLLLFIHIQIVCSQDKIYPRGIPRPARYWSVGVQLGGASLLASPANYELSMLYYSPPHEHPNYDKQIPMGWYLNGNAYYLISNYFGLGVNYSFHTFSLHNEFTEVFSYHKYFYMRMGQKQYIHYIGPSVIFRQWLNKSQKLELTEMLSAGHVHYRDELRIDSYTDPYYPYHRALIEGNTWSANACLSMNYYPISWLSIGASAGFAYARLNKVGITTNTRKETIELDHQPLSFLNYSLSVRFHIFD